MAQVTALDADASHCALEISIIAWGLSAEGMLAFHRILWEKTDHVKSLDSTDFRIRTEGDLYRKSTVLQLRLFRGQLQVTD